jgi:cobalamin biosynthesis protein CobT
LARFVEKKTKVLSRKYDQKLQKQHRATQKKSQNKSEYSDDQSEESDSDDFSAEDERDEEQLDEEGEDEDVFDGEEDEEEGEEDDASNNDREDIPGDFKDDVEMEAWLDAFEEMEYAHKEKMEKKEKRAKASTVESRVSWLHRSPCLSLVIDRFSLMCEFFSYHLILFVHRNGKMKRRKKMI